MKEFGKLLLCLGCLLMGGVQKMNAQSGVLSQREGTTQRAGSITFVVDRNLPAPEGHLMMMDDDDLTAMLMSQGHISNDDPQVVACSYKGQQIGYVGSDVLFQCMVKAYAEHRPLVLSPDVVWLIISQGFANYVNAHAEELRPLLVDHDGKMTLTVRSQHELLSGDVDWEQLMDGFAAQIGQYTKDDVAQTIAADFSTTGPTERIASRITLMDAVKSFFDYQIIYVACGIPQITLQGTPEDWQAVLDKATKLRRYGLDAWIGPLEPVLTQFVRTAQGHPNRHFWQNIVKKKRVDELRGGGCSPEKPTKLDGWFLTFFPDKNGKVYEKVTHLADMERETVQVDFKYLQLDPASGRVSETPMQLMAGFIGVEEDTTTYALTPKIGWIVRVGNAESDAMNNLRQSNERGSIDLRVAEVPEMLRELPHIASLSLTFTGKVVLPEWMDGMQIDELYVFGDMTDAEKASLRQRFPKIKFSYLE